MEKFKIINGVKVYLLKDWDNAPIPKIKHNIKIGLMKIYINEMLDFRINTPGGTI